MAGQDPAATLRRLTNGYQVAQAIHVVATLGIADHIAAGVHGCRELAVATDADADALYRVLRALAAAGVFVEEDDRQFQLTAVGEHLRSDVPRSLAGWAAFIGRPNYWEAWGHLIDSVRTGENAFRLTHGVGPWEYRSTRPEESAIFDRAMTSLTSQVSAAVLAAYDFTPFARVADIGGGSGAFVVGLLTKYPDLSAVLFDQPHVVANAEAVLATGDLAPRCTIVGGDFFGAVPGGVDAYVLKAVVHDWPDAEAIRILSVCRASSPDATVLLVERELGGPNENTEGKFSDLNMLVGPGGQERTVEAYRALFEAAGYQLARVVPTASPVIVLEAH